MAATRQQYLQNVTSRPEIYDVLGGLISEYTGGECDVNTKEGARCWYSEEHKNCDHFCFDTLEHLQKWLFPIFQELDRQDIQISLENGTGKQNQVTIYDLVGNVVFQSAENTSSALLNVDLSNVPAGMYIVQVIDGQKRFTSKVIRQ